ncbi:MAG: TrkA family potassium uptake protein [Actinomycetota bacterium]|jgi:trk system potassium uptake protein|nr:TrkA family potassium uptake protein [Actinomycetota bacterium]
MPDSGGGVFVVGLGRFGSAMASKLMDLGHDVLAVDENLELVQAHSSVVTTVAQIDSTSRDALLQLGADEFHYAVVAIGSNVEASILTTSLLSELGVDQIWAKANSDAHATILERVGAHHVVMPEQEMGARVAHLVTGQMADYMLLEDDFAMVETSAPTQLCGATLEGSQVRDRFGVTVVGWKPVGQRYTYAKPDTMLERGDTLLVVGRPDEVAAFAKLA